MKLLSFSALLPACLIGANAFAAAPATFDVRCKGSVGLMRGVSTAIDATLHWNGTEKSKLVLAEGLPGKSGEISVKIRPDSGDGTPTTEIYGWYVDGYKNISAKGSALFEVRLQHQDAVTGREIDLVCAPVTQAPSAVATSAESVVLPPLPRTYRCDGTVTEHFDEATKKKTKHVRRDVTWNTVVQHRELLSAHFPTRGGEFSLRLTPAMNGPDGEAQPAQMAIEAWYIDRTKNTDSRGTPYQPVFLSQVDAQKNRKIVISCRPIY